MNIFHFMLINRGIWCSFAESLWWYCEKKNEPPVWEARRLWKKYVFSKKCLSSIPIPKPLSPGKGLYYWGYRPRPSKEACSQPHKATARCGGTNGWRPVRGLRPKAMTLWLLAKSFARCKTNKASNARHPIFINDRSFSTDWSEPPVWEARKEITYSFSSCWRWM